MGVAVAAPAWAPRWRSPSARGSAPPSAWGSASVWALRRRPARTGTVAVSEVVLAPRVPGALVSTGNVISTRSPGFTKPAEKNPHVTARPTGVPQDPTTAARVRSLTDPAW